MTPIRIRIQQLVALALCLGALAAGGVAEAADPLRVVTTTPDLENLVREVGGDAVEVDSFTVGVQDPHFIEPRPSFIRRLSDADLFVQVGLDLEVGWAPVLLRSARNPDVQPGRRGYLDVSNGVEVLQRGGGRLDRSAGDVHPRGNPHYLLDPVNGLRVAEQIRDRLAELRPEQAEHFEARHADFARRLESRLAGWRERLAPRAGAPVVVDHNLWPYFARRFELEVVDALEPLPGIPPTTRHLAEVVERIETRSIRAILSVPYFDARHAERVAERTDARVARMAHQVGAREGTGDYLAMVEHNVSELARALEGGNERAER